MWPAHIPLCKHCTFTNQSRAKAGWAAAMSPNWMETQWILSFIPTDPSRNRICFQKIFPPHLQSFKIGSPVSRRLDIPFLLSTFLIPSTPFSWLVFWNIWGWKQPSYKLFCTWKSTSDRVTRAVLGGRSSGQSSKKLRTPCFHFYTMFSFLLLLLLSSRWTKRPMMYKYAMKMVITLRSLHCK